MGRYETRVIFIDRFDEYSKDERVCAEKLCKILQQIEQLAMLPFALGTGLAFALVLVGYFFGILDNIPNNVHPGIYGMCVLGSLNIITSLILKVLFFAPQCIKKVRELRQIAELDPCYSAVIERLNDIDPYITKKIRDFVNLASTSVEL